MKALLAGLMLCAGLNSFGQYISGQVYARMDDGVLILETVSSLRPYVALTNYSNDRATLGRHIGLSARRIGIYRYDDAPLELWEYIPPPGSVELARQFSAAQTNAAHGAIYIQRARAILNQIQAEQAGLEAQIALASSSTNVTATNMLARLQAQKMQIDSKLKAQQEAVQRLEDFYKLPPK